MKQPFFEKLKYQAGSQTAITLVFGFAFYWAYSIRSGANIGSSSRFFLFQWIAAGTEVAVDSFGAQTTGHTLMGLTLAAWVFTCVWFWNNDFF